MNKKRIKKNKIFSCANVKNEELYFERQSFVLQQEYCTLEIFRPLFSLFRRDTRDRLLISGMAQLDVQRSGRIGVRALTYYSITTILAAIVGIAMVLMIHPGNPQIKTTVAAVVKAEETKVSTVDAILDIIRYGKAASL